MSTTKEPKIRSTCNACQDAKVRCSRDKPTCRRCQKKNRHCLYSYSQRLGRPGARKNVERSKFDDENPLLQTQEIHREGHTLSDRFDPSAASSDGGAVTTQFLGSSAAPSDTSTEPRYGGTRAPSVFTDGGDEIRAMGDFEKRLNTDNPINLTSTDSAMALLPPFPSDLDFEHFFNTPRDDVRPGPPQTHAVPLPGHVNLFDYHALLGQSNTVINPAGSNSMTMTPTTSALSQSDVSASSFDDHILQPGRPKTSPGSNDFSRPSRNLDSNLTRGHRSSGSLRSVLLDTDSLGPNPKLYSHGATSCKCYVSVRKRLSDLYYHPSSSSPTIDEVMKVEKDVRAQICEVLDCKYCSSNGVRIFFLLGIVLENIVDLLEDFSVDDIRGTPENSIINWNMSSQSSSVGSNLASGTRSPIAMDGPPLKLGSYEISGDEKVYFLQHLVRTRLQQLLATIVRLHEQQNRRQDATFKAGTTLTMELYQRLQAVIRRFES